MDRLFAAEVPRPALRHYRLVVISPHLDDAVFSCAARMAAARREGPVLVVNVFSRFATDVKTRGVVLGDHRHAEEAAAAQLLGFETLRLDALDVSFRDLHYRALSNIFGPPVEADLAFALAKRRREAADFPGAGRIKAELASGPARKRVALMVLEGAPAREGAEIADAEGQVIGVVTSGGFSPSLGKPIAMGFVPPALSGAGTRLNVIVRGKHQAAEVTAMPFVPHRYVRKV